YYHPHVGGIETHLEQLCGELKSKVDLEVVVSSSGREESVDDVNGVRVRRCGEVVKVASTSICPSMVRALSEADYDIIHIHTPNPMGVMSYLAAKKPRNHRIVVTHHSDVVKQKTLQRMFQPFMDLVMTHASAIVCTSPDYLESSTELVEFRDRCEIVPYGIDLVRFAASDAVSRDAAMIRERYGAPLLMATGRLIYYKGFEVLIEAMRHVEANVMFLGDGPLRASLEDRAAAAGVATRVSFVGEVPNEKLMPYYEASDIFVFPSIARSEAFGIVQLEAMACARPVVNTSLDSGVPFVSRHEESGLTVRPEDPYALASAIRKLLADEEWRRMLGERGRRRVETEFTKEKMATRILDIYERALGKEKNAPEVIARTP
ncbi:MAG: glycosyltransferase, partial [Polyangiaceae bacterium]